MNFTSVFWSKYVYNQKSFKKYSRFCLAIDLCEGLFQIGTIELQRRPNSMTLTISLTA